MSRLLRQQRRHQEFLHEGSHHFRTSDGHTCNLSRPSGQFNSMSFNFVVLLSALSSTNSPFPFTCSGSFLQGRALFILKRQARRVLLGILSDDIVKQTIKLMQMSPFIADTYTFPLCLTSSFSAAMNSICILCGTCACCFNVYTHQNLRKLAYSQYRTSLRGMAQM